MTVRETGSAIACRAKDSPRTPPSTVLQLNLETAKTESPPKPRPPLSPTVILLGWVSFWNDAASEMVYPLIPSLLFGASGRLKRMLGLIEGAAETVASLLKLISGTWSDRLRTRRWFIVAGYLLAAVCRPCLSLVTAAWQVLALRLTERVGKGLRQAPRDALVADCTVPAERPRAYAFQKTLDHAGAAVGPLLAAVFLWYQPTGTRWILAAAVVPGSIVAGLILWGVRDVQVVSASEADSNAKSAAKPLPAFGTNFRWLLFAILIFTLGNTSDMFLLERGRELNLTAGGTLLLWAGFSTLKSSISWIGGRCIERWGAPAVISVGWLWYAVVYLGFAFATTLPQVVALFAAYAVFYALYEPAIRSLTAELVPADVRGSAFGWLNATIGLGALPGNIAFGYAYQHFSPLVAFGSAAALAVVATGVLSFVRRPQVTDKP